MRRVPDWACPRTLRWLARNYQAEAREAERVANDATDPGTRLANRDRAEKRRRDAEAMFTFAEAVER